MTSTPLLPASLLVDARTAARMLAISPRTLWSLTAEGMIPVVRLSARTVRYAVADLERTIEARKGVAHAE